MGINKYTHLNLIIPSHCNHNLIIVIIFQLIAITKEILLILHVANGILIIIHNVIWYNYMYSNIIIIILV